MWLVEVLLEGAWANLKYMEVAINVVDLLKCNCLDYLFLGFFCSYFDSFFLKTQRNFSFS